MKIRMRHNHQQVREADRLSGFPDYGWSAFGPLDGERVLYSTHDWELVPTELWYPVCLSRPLYVGELCLPNGIRLVLPPGMRIRPIPEANPCAVVLEVLSGFDARGGA